MRSVNHFGDVFFVWRDRSIYRIRASSSWVEWFAGAEPAKRSYKDGNRYCAQFLKILGIEANDEYGRLWISDNETFTIRAIIGNQVSTIAGSTGEKAHKDGPSHLARFTSPGSIIRLHSRCCLLIAEHGISHYLRLLDLRSMNVTTLTLNFGLGPAPHTDVGLTLSPTWNPGYPVANEEKEIVDVTYYYTPTKDALYRYRFTVDLSSLVEASSPNIGAIATPPVRHMPLVSTKFGPHKIWFDSFEKVKWKVGITSGLSYPTTVDDLKSTINWLLELDTNRTPLYLPHTNQLLIWCTSQDTIHVFDHFLNPRPAIPSIPSTLVELRSSRRLPHPIDFSSLLSSPVLGDVPISNDKSAKKWMLHSRVLSLHKELRGTLTQSKFSKLTSVIKTCTFAAPTILAFFKYLYFGNIAGYDHAPFGGTKALCTLFAHVSWLCKLSGGVRDSRIVLDFMTFVLPSLTVEAGISCLIELWTDSRLQWTNEPIIIALLSHIVYSGGFNDLTTGIRNSGMNPQQSAALIDLFASDSSLTATHAHVTALDFSTIALGPSVVDLSWVVSNHPSALLRTSDYAFGICGQDNWLVVPGEYIWPQWSWFRNWLDSQVSETRIVRFDGRWMNKIMLEAILSSMCHGSKEFKLDMVSCTTLLEHVKELEICGGKNDAVPTSICFHPLVAHLKQTNSDLTSISEVQNHHELNDSFDFVKMEENFIDQILQAEVPMTITDAFEQLELDLIIKAYHRYHEKKNSGAGME